MKPLACLILVAACGGDRRGDCEIVRDEPARAVAKLAKRYREAPTKLAEAIERCVAPTGDECERIAKVVTAIPDLAPELPKASDVDSAKTCRESSAELRRCLLPSYVIDHIDECERARQGLSPHPITSLFATTILDATAGFGYATGSRRRAPGCGRVAVFIGEQGVWLATGTEEKARCYAPRKAGAIDEAWLVARLRASTTDRCVPAVDIAGAPSVTFKELRRAVLTAAFKADLLEADLAPVDDLAVPLAQADTARASRTCPGGTIVTSADDARPFYPPSNYNPSRDAPVLFITQDELRLGTKHIGTLADAKIGNGELVPLREALPTPTRSVALLRLEADEDTPAGVIDRVLTTAKSAGYKVSWSL